MAIQTPQLPNTDQCPSCLVDPTWCHHTYGGSMLTCPGCYDGAPDAGMQLQGEGRTDAETIEVWNEAVADYIAVHAKAPVNHWKLSYEDMSPAQAAYCDIKHCISGSDAFTAMRALKRFRNLTFVAGTDGGVTAEIRSAMVAWEYEHTETNMLKLHSLMHGLDCKS